MQWKKYEWEDVVLPLDLVVDPVERWRISPLNAVASDSVQCV
jgi:hypothetical protein